MAIRKLSRWSLGTLLDGLLEKTGGTMTGALTLAGAPTADLHAGTKKYIDDKVAAVASYPPPRIQSPSSGTSLNLADTDVVNFIFVAPGTISSFTNVVAGKMYIFTNGGAAAVTIDRSNAHLHGSTNVILNTNDVVLMIGRTATAIKQAAPMSDNG